MYSCLAALVEIADCIIDSYAGKVDHILESKVPPYCLHLDSAGSPYDGEGARLDLAVISHPYCSMSVQKEHQLIRKALRLVLTYTTKPPAVAPWSKSEHERYLRKATRRNAQNQFFETHSNQKPHYGVNQRNCIGYS